MREKKENTHIVIERQLGIYQCERGAVWQCKFNVDGRWNRSSTNERHLAKLKKAAHDILIKANVKKELNISTVTLKIKYVANTVPKQLEAGIEKKIAKPVYKDHVSVLKSYVIPILGKYSDNIIKREALDECEYEYEYETKHTKKIGKPLTYRTQLTHIAVLNLIFDEALIQRFMTELDSPKLIAKGKVSECRPAFELDEIHALKEHFNDWIKREENSVSKNLRTLLKKYLYVLLDTWARPNKELLKLSLKQVRHAHTDDSGCHVEMNVGGKTGKQKIIAWGDTIDALKRLLKIQNLGGTEVVKESNHNGYLFKMKDCKELQSFQKLFEVFPRQQNLLIT